MLTHVTFTGWDRHTDLAELEEFLQACPQATVEIAVLHSSSKNDEDRYPLAKQAEEILRTAKASGQRTALHLCGRAAREMLDSATTNRDGSRVNVSFAVADLLRLADRVQVNVDDGFWAPGPEKYRRAYEAAHVLGRPVIVQSRSVGGWPDVEHLAPRASRMVPFLFDRSAGRGLVPDERPTPIPGRLVGYAGGLGPDNVGAFMARLHSPMGRQERYWIDMESGIREQISGQAYAVTHSGLGPLVVEDNAAPPTRISIVRCAAVMKAVEKYMERPC